MKTKKLTRKTESANGRCLQQLVSTPHETDWKALDAQILKYRKEKFAVEVIPAEHPLEEGEVALSTTTNGYQWQTITLLKCEVEKVIAALRANGALNHGEEPKP